MGTRRRGVLASEAGTYDRALWKGFKIYPLGAEGTEGAVCLSLEADDDI